MVIFNRSELKDDFSRQLRSIREIVESIESKKRIHAVSNNLRLASPAEF